MIVTTLFDGRRVDDQNVTPTFDDDGPCDALASTGTTRARLRHKRGRVVSVDDVLSSYAGPDLGDG